jgi:hypothetical protein
VHRFALLFSSFQINFERTPTNNSRASLDGECALIGRR